MDVEYVLTCYLEGHELGNGERGKGGKRDHNEKCLDLRESGDSQRSNAITTAACSLGWQLPHRQREPHRRRPIYWSSALA